MTRHSIPFRLPSLKSDYASPDGEIAVAGNLVPCLDPGAGEDPDDSGNDSGAVSSGSAPFTLTLPPPPEAEFSLRKTILPGWHSHPDILPSVVMDAGERTETGWGVRAIDVLEKFEAGLSGCNLFFEPFFVICALRMNDGTRILPSPPVLMIPNSAAPPVEGSLDFSSDTMEMRVVAAVCSLQWRVRIPENLKTFPGISHLDIFVSDAIPLYDRKSSPLADHRFSCSNFTHSSGSEQPVYESSIVQGWIPEGINAASFHKALCDATSFRLVSEISFDTLNSMEDFADVVFNCGGLEMKESYDPYIPDYIHRSEVTAAGSSRVSMRTTVWNLTLVPPLPLPMSQSAPYVVPDSVATPRWVFHPDPVATSYVYESGGKVLSVPLRRHPMLHGSFWWRGMEADAPEGVETEAVMPDAGSRAVNFPAAVWRSSKGSIIHFPDSLFMQLDVEKVMAVCRAFRASGLVATTAPTAYLFTTEGVFLLREMDDGTFRDAGLICTHVLKDASSYSLKGRSVVFLTENGDVVEIQGTTVKVNSGTSGSSEDTGLSAGIAYGALTPGEESRLVTRPLKLGDAERWKRIIEVRLRGNYDFSSCRMSLYGSPDLRVWRRIATRQGGIISGLWSPLCRYFRVEATLRLQSGDTLEALYAISDQ